MGYNWAKETNTINYIQKHFYIFREITKAAY